MTLAGPEAVTFTVSTYYKRPKGEPGLTTMGSVRIDLVQALNWILQELPDDALKIEESEPDTEFDLTTFVINWKKVPDYIKDPPRPAPRRRR